MSTQADAEGLMSADSALTAMAVLRALLAEDTECLAVLLPDGIPDMYRHAAMSWPWQIVMGHALSRAFSR